MKTAFMMICLGLSWSTVAFASADHDALPRGSAVKERPLAQGKSSAPYLIDEFTDCGSVEYPVQKDGTRLWSKWVVEDKGMFSRTQPSNPKSKCVVLVSNRNGTVQGMILPLTPSKLNPKVTVVPGEQIGRVGQFVLAPSDDLRKPVEFMAAPCVVQDEARAKAQGAGVNMLTVPILDSVVSKAESPQNVQSYARKSP